LACWFLASLVVSSSSTHDFFKISRGFLNQPAILMFFFFQTGTHQHSHQRIKPFLQEAAEDHAAVVQVEARVVFGKADNTRWGGVICWDVKPVAGCKRHHQDDITFVGILVNINFPLRLASWEGWFGIPSHFFCMCSVKDTSRSFLSYFFSF